MNAKEKAWEHHLKIQKYLLTIVGVMVVILPFAIAAIFYFDWKGWL